MYYRKGTSQPVASLAGEALGDPGTPPHLRAPIASALSQHEPRPMAESLCQGLPRAAAGQLARLIATDAGVAALKAVLAQQESRRRALDLAHSLASRRRATILSGTYTLAEFLRRGD